jgi:hypothetical protein
MLFSLFNHVQACTNLMLCSCLTAGYTPAVTDFEGLKALARAQRVGTNTERRGACKLCGGLGHRTNQCKNFLNASGQGGEGAAADGPANMALIPDDDEDGLLLSSDLDSDSSGSGSSSNSSDDEERRRKVGDGFIMEC